MINCGYDYAYDVGNEYNYDYVDYKSCNIDISMISMVFAIMMMTMTMAMMTTTIEIMITIMIVMMIMIMMSITMIERARRQKPEAGSQEPPETPRARSKVHSRRDLCTSRTIRQSVVAATSDAARLELCELEGPDSDVRTDGRGHLGVQPRR